MNFQQVDGYVKAIQGLMIIRYVTRDAASIMPPLAQIPNMLHPRTISACQETKYRKRICATLLQLSELDKLFQQTN